MRFIWNRPQQLDAEQFDAAAGKHDEWHDLIEGQNLVSGGAALI